MSDPTEAPDETPCPGCPDCQPGPVLPYIVAISAWFAGLTIVGGFVGEAAGNYSIGAGVAAVGSSLCAAATIKVFNAAKREKSADAALIDELEQQLRVLDEANLERNAALLKLQTRVDDFIGSCAGGYGDE